jgi:hypothetical protein
MQISVNTPALMIVTARPVLLSLALGALLAISLYLAAYAVAQGEWLRAVALGPGFGGASVAGLIVFFRVVTLRLDRAAGTATLRRRGLFGQTEATYQLAMIAAAKVETTPARRGTQNLTGGRVVLELRADTGQIAVPLTTTFSGGSGPTQVARAITTWLSAP